MYSKLYRSIKIKTKAPQSPAARGNECEFRSGNRRDSRQQSAVESTHTDAQEQITGTFVSHATIIAQEQMYNPRMQPFISRLNSWALCLIGSLLLTACAVATPPSACPDCQVGSFITSPIDGMQSMYVPAGTFTMGNESGNNDEKPVHEVYLDAFWIDQTEVTNAMYAQCVAATTCQPPASAASYTHTPYYGNPEFDTYPVVYVSWSQAQAYCQWAGRRLPTEAEWEKSARGTDGRTYPWGNAVPESKYLNFRGEFGDMSAVGSYPAGVSPYGALDMAGNVIEWVASLHLAYPYEAVDGRENMDTPNGRFVIRGGAWGDFDSYVYAAHRDWLNQMDTGYYLGFRCARSQ